MAKLRPELPFCNLSRTAPVINLEKLKLCHIPCDLGNGASVEEAAQQVKSFLNSVVPAGRVLLINNSGFGSYGEFPEPNLMHQLAMVDVNIRGLVDLTGRLFDVLKSRGGVIMNVASTAAFQPTPFMATYGATKAFVLHWSLAMNEELRGTGLRTLAVCPGPTSTQFFRRAGLDARSTGGALSMSSEEVVVQALKALAAGRSLVVTGWANKITAVAGGMAPKRLVTWMAAKIIARYKNLRVAK
ncbi:MAG: SDR family NAD(P)-dependent oxidoreductase [Opitutus sp.]